MGAIKNSLKAVLLSTLFITGCGVNLPVTKLNPFEKESVLQIPITSLSGVVETPEGELIEINSEREKPLVLVFASDTCSTCSSEARHFSEHLKNNEAIDLANVDYITVLIGAYPEDIVAWKERLNVTWRTGFESSDAMFENFCPEKLTPCVITFDPETKKISRFVGETSLDRLQENTQEWTYKKENQ